jgi:hypothetical protein
MLAIPTAIAATAFANRLASRAIYSNVFAPMIAPTDTS